MTGMQAFLAERVITGERIIPAGAVLVQGERILAVGRAAELAMPAEAECCDLGDGILCPGLVDIHAHGGDGADCTDGTPEAVLTVARRHLRAGTTSLLPTTATAPLEEIWRAFDSIIAARAEQKSGSLLAASHQRSGADETAPRDTSGPRPPTATPGRWPI